MSLFSLFFEWDSGAKKKVGCVSSEVTGTTPLELRNASRHVLNHVPCHAKHNFARNLNKAKKVHAPRLSKKMRKEKRGRNKAGYTAK